VKSGNFEMVMHPVVKKR